jgi:molybdate transport system substrate-binding protein
MMRNTFPATVPVLMLCLNGFLLSSCFDKSDSRVNNSRAEAASSEKIASVSVAAAANLKFAFDQLEKAFEAKHPQIDLKVTFGSSGNFFAQLSQQAPFDIFFSANTDYPEELVKRGLAEQSSYFRYADGKIVLWVRDDSPLDLEQLEIRAVLAPSVKKIAIANPRLAPYGVAAEEALKSLSVYDAAQKRFVTGENITQTGQFVESGAAEIGVLAYSLALAPRMQQEGRFWEIPTTSYQPIQQAAVIPAHSRNREAATKFKDFILSPEGQQILHNFGYSTPKE